MPQGDHTTREKRGRARPKKSVRARNRLVTADVDELHRANQALRESEVRFRQIAENIREVFWLTDLDHNVIYVSPAYEEVWGRSRNSLLGTVGGFLDGVHPDDRAVVRDLAQDLEQSALTYRIVRPDGEIRWIHDRAFPVRDEEGNVIRIAGIAEDITARRALQQDLEMQAHILASVAQAIICTDPEGVVITWNRQAEIVFGWTAAEAVGRNLVGLIIHEDDRSEVRFGLERLGSGKTLSAERQVQRKDGEVIWVAAEAVPLANSEGRITHIVGTCSDISERRRLEAQYLQAQKMEAVGRLAGGVAHDFNNLLTVMKANCEFLSDDLPREGRAREDLDEIAKATQRAAALTRQLLAFSRQQVLERKVVEPNGIVSDLEKMLGRLIGDDIQLLVELDPRIPAVVADAGQIEQAVVNLVVNARDAMPDGGELRIRTTAMQLTEERARAFGDARPGVYSVIEVCDTGVGIPAAVRARLFEPFFTTKEAGRGTGLGLATVYGIVHQSGGFMDVRSVVGKGSTFFIHLPAAERNIDHVAIAPSAAPLAAGTGTILLVEDQESVRGVVRRVLANQGYTVIEASNGNEALARLSEHSGGVDLLLTDAVMPEMGGADLIREVRARYGALPVVMVSGHTDDRSIWRGYASPHTVFLAKPFSADEITRAIRKAMNHGEVTQSRPAA